MPTSGLIIEDLPDAAHWLSGVLIEAFPKVVVRTVATIAEARTALYEYPPDIALVDLNLPDGSGIELIPLVRALRSESYAIVTTIYDDDAHVFPALRAGAQGYLLKDESQEDLVRQLRSILRGELPLSPSVARAVLRHFSAESAPEPLHSHLTSKEREVLAAVADGATVGEAAQRLGITRNTAATHVKRIYSKLSISSRAEAARIAAQLGIVAPRPDA
jgi:DNA-binding NarL/FixJ family response regulator